ncbi:hypothetical protein SAMN05192558_102402 [Actinokineospora alba]|uniref:Uncharacterized protein n=1 Tax=Actinokineospora alba TaxID=504798 RepID=A0A1H0I4C0_9PSEU|nr:hypothetical protein [Actinokineospora alba]TDP64609.1 hypothetical protein C8E96_0076 [Actinokineospora alba]SDI86024.1 hypothetical protein SAMN05421871_108101 [Actinokineospora alba]SDO26278.1 hypothetical protein SAMN05192558_102402 [Actinokineospora alba]
MSDPEVGTNQLAARLTVTAALLLGISTIVLFTAIPGRAGRFALLAVVIVLGVAVFAAGSRAFGRFSYTVGPTVCRGVGGGAIVLGAYLSGPLLVDAVGETSLTTSVLLTFLPAFLALLVLALKGVGAGVVGAAVVAPTVLVLLLAANGAGPGTTALCLLALAVAAAVVAVPAPSSWSTAGISAGAIAAAAAVGGGATPLGALTGPPVFDAMPEPGMRALVIVAGLVLLALFGALAMLRRDTAGGVFVGLALVAPVPMLVHDQMVSGRLDSAAIAMAVVPLAVAIAVACAVTVGSARQLAGRLAGWLRPSGSTTVPALLSVAGVTAVVFAAQPLPSLVPDIRLQGAIAVVLLAFAVVLALRLCGMPGAIVAAAALIGLQTMSPWRRLLAGLVEPGGDPFAHLKVIVGATVVAAVAVTWLLLRRHRHVGVVVAAAYLLAGTLADLVRAISLLGGWSDRESVWVTTTIVPLLILGLPAAVAALVARAAPTRVAGQAVAALMVVIGGFSLFKALLRTFSGANPGEPTVLTPTDFTTLTSLDQAGGPVAFGVAGLLLVAALATLSTTRHASAAVVAAVMLFGVGGTQVVLGIALQTGGGAAFDLVQWIVLGVSAVVTAAAVVTVRSSQSPLAAEEARPPDGPLPAAQA